MQRVRELVALTVALVALFVAAVPAAAQQAGDNSVSERAAAFTGEASGAIPGGLGGHFQFFKFQYPGNHTMRFNLNATPNDAAILQYVGFKVYASNAREVLTANAAKDSNPSATAELFAPEVGEYVLQVFNYAPDAGATIHFTLTSGGLPPQPASARPATLPAVVAAVAAPVAPAPAGAAPAPVGTPTTDNSTAPGAWPFDGKKIDGALSSGQGGFFKYYKFQYTGDDRKVSINLSAQPADSNVLQYVGFKLYGPNPGQEYLNVKLTKDAVPNGTGTLANREPGEYVIHYNTNPELVVYFQLDGSNLPEQPRAAASVPMLPAPGLTAPALPGPMMAPPPIAAAPLPAPAPMAPAAAPAQPTDISDPSRAAALTGQASNVLAGNSGGKFHYYKFRYPGGKRKVSVSIFATPNDPEVLKFVGIKVYGPTPGKEYAAVGAQKELASTTEFESEEVGEYVVQIYNYVPNPEIVVTYTVTVSGL